MAVSDSKNKVIQIPSNHYVALGQTLGGLPYGHMVPDGTDAKAKKRRERVERYAKSCNSTKEVEARAIENKPMMGFKIYRNSSAAWNAEEVSWYIQDPRGFVVSASQGNLSKIMEFCTIENGEILEKCCWGNIGSDNILVPVSSDIYKSAQINTERVNKRVGLRDVKIGNTILTHEGDTFVYLGSYNIIERSSYRAHYENEFVTKRVTVNSNKRYFLATVGDDGSWTKVRYVTNIKVSEIVKDDVLDPKETELNLNQYITSGKSLDCTGYSYSIVLGVLSKHLDIDVKFELEPSTIDVNNPEQNSFSKIAKVNGSDYGIIAAGELRYTYRKPELHLVNTDKLLDDGIIECLVTPKRCEGYYRPYDAYRGNDGHYYQDMYKTFELEKADMLSYEWYDIVFKVNTPLGNALALRF